MQRRHLRLVGVLTFTLTAIAVGAGCDSDSGPSGVGGVGGAGGSAGSSGGSAGTSGAASGSAGAASGSGGGLGCSNVSACGGDVVGSWTVTSSCLALTGEFNAREASLGCPTVPWDGSLQPTGTLVLDAGGTFADNTATSGAVTFTLRPACVSVSSVAIACEKAGNAFTSRGWTTAKCAETNRQCDCSLSASQSSGLGAIVPFTEPTGTYTVSGTTLTVANVTYSYCVSGDTLTVTPQMSGLVGTVTLKRGSSSGGAGGMSGAGAGGGGAGSSGASGASGASMGGQSAAGAGGAGATAGAGAMSGAGAGGAAGMSGAAGAPPTTTGPCDIYEAAGHTCVTAHSTVRALYGAYTGNLYQVKRADGMTRDIPVKSTGGFADSAQQESFCSGTTCTMWRIYDQSGHGNFLEAETPDSSVGGFRGQSAANASAESLTVGGNKVYSLFTRPNQAYWRDGSASGMPLGAEPQGVYMVTSGTHYNGGCCYNYGNAQTSRIYEGGPTMDSVYFGDCDIWGTGAGDGPWVMADMEDGIASGSGTGQNPNLESLSFPYVTALVKNNGRTEYAIKGANATALPLKTFYQGALPPGKNPMKKEGAIVLGSGGDCCLMNNNQSEGTFYEGAIVSGYPSNETDEAIHANIVAAGYGK